MTGANTDRTPTRTVVVGCADGQTSRKGLPSRQVIGGGGVQECYLPHPPARAFEGVSGGKRIYIQQFVTLHNSGAANGRKCFAA